MEIGAKSRVASAADALRSLILTRELEPGSPLRQEALAARLQVSRTPLRQAIQILADEGIVTLADYRGARVAQIRAQDVSDVFAMRLALEPLALADALPKLTKIHLAEAEMVLDEAANETSPIVLSDLNWRFHLALYAPCGRALLLDTIEKLNRNAVRAEIVALSIAARIRASHAEHRDLLEACRGQNRTGARALLNAHLSAARKVSLAALEETDHARQ